MNIETKIKKLVELKDKILKESKKWKGTCCPLKMYEDSEESFEKSHYYLSQLFSGLGCWKWNCPFCGEGFQE